MYNKKCPDCGVAYSRLNAHRGSRRCEADGNAARAIAAGYVPAGAAAHVPPVKLVMKKFPTRYHRGFKHSPTRVDEASWYPQWVHTLYYFERGMLQQAHSTISVKHFVLLTEACEAHAAGNEQRVDEILDWVEVCNNMQEAHE